MPTTPFALEWDEWETWHQTMSKKHPVWYLFHHRIPRIWDRFTQRLSDARWWVLHRVHPKHRYHVVSTGLPPGYHDPDTIILHVAFEQLMRFHKHWDWSGDPQKYAEAHVADIPLDADYRQGVWDHRFGFASDVEELVSYWKNRKESWDTDSMADEEKINEQDEKMLHKLVSIRLGLWN